MLGLDPLATVTVVCVVLAAAALLGAELLHLTRSQRQADQGSGETRAAPTWGIVATGVCLALAVIFAVACAAVTWMGGW